MKGRVIITEKKSVADSIASVMKWKSSRMGYEGTFEGAPVYLVWARGHLLTMETPDEANPGVGWNNPEALVPVPRNVSVKIIEEPGVNHNQTIAYRMEVIKSAMDLSDEVILATDSDREGEYIGWLILEHYNWKKPVRRCWLTGGMDEITINKAMTNLLPASDKKSMARAAEARARCDWAYMYLVRLLTFYGRQGHMGKNLGAGVGRESVVSIGRVQSAALYMIFKRELDIRNFVPKTFYKLFGEFNTGEVNLKAEYRPRVTADIIKSEPAGVTWEPQGLEGENKLDRPLFTGSAEVGLFEARLKKSADQATVHSYEEGTKENHPPITFDLVAAKSALAGECKISAVVAQTIIEDLYEQGFISYPRTAHGELPLNLYEPAERDTRLHALAGIPSLTVAAQKAMAIHGGNDSQYKAFRPKVFVTKKLEHFGLIPTQKRVDSSVLASMRAVKATGKKVVHTSEHMQAGYMLIAQRFIQALLPPAKIATQKVSFSVPVEDILGNATSMFSATAERTIDPGWRGIMNTGGKKTTEIPKLQNGLSAPLEKISREEGKTKAPSRYSELNFEKAMQGAAREVNDPELRKYMADGTNKPEGIGTPATRQTIVPTLKARGYVRSDKKDIYYLERKGEDLINYLMDNNHHWMYRIETTAEWEGKLAEMTEIEDDSVAVRERDAFVEDNLVNIDNFIIGMNEKYRGKVGFQHERVPQSVSPKMKAVIKSISEKKGIKLPSGTLTDPKKAKVFLDEHMAKRDPNSPQGSSAPSEAQLKFAAQIEKDTGIKISEEQKQDRSKIAAYIDANMKKMAPRAPSEKMIKYAKSIAKGLDKNNQPADNVFTDAKACSAFIDANKGPSKSK